ncbi:MAG: triose-phosphate isomerase [Pseudomonadota bacterium]
MRKLIAGNWKMNGLGEAIAEIKSISAGLSALDDMADALICPPMTLVASFASACSDSRLEIGAQDCHTAVSGAYTGDVSAKMIADAGASYVIVGHSERRADHAELSTLVAEKAEAALYAGLIPIICIGESLSDRETGLTNKVVLGQLNASIPEYAVGRDFVVAYEPIWAIGTGKTATVEQIGDTHGVIRDALVERFGEPGRFVRLLYGGSMKPANAREILATPNVDGGLIGGASLKADDFLAIYKSVV